MSEKNNKNGLYMIIGALIVVALGLGYVLTKDQKKEGFKIEVSEDGIEVQEN